LARQARVLAGIGFVLAACAGTLNAQHGSPAGPVAIDRLAARRTALAAKLGTGLAIIGSQDLRDLERDYLQDSDFRQDNNFFYLTGLETPSSWLVVRATGSGRPDAVLYLPPRDPAQEAWTGPKLGPGPEAAAMTGIAEVRSTESFESDLAAWLAGSASPAPSTVYVSLGAAARDSTLARMLQGYRGSVTDAAPILASLRLVKDEDELQRLRRAIQITGEAHREAMRFTAPGQYEYQIEAAIEYVFRAHGAERLGFPSIVGAGPNSVTLHYDKNRRQTDGDDLIVIDIGAEFGYYTADVTRTLPVAGRFTPRQRAIYELVLGAQEAAMRAVRPGITIRELDRISRAYMDQNSGSLCGSDPCTRYFIHGLSHWLGMDVHDVGDYRTPLAEGMVLTIEPGIYIPEEELGVRIEDDVLVTRNGYELLTADVPRAVDAIESLMQRQPEWVTGRP